MCRNGSSSDSSTNVASVMELRRKTRKSFQSQNRRLTPVCGGGTHLETCWKLLFFSWEKYMLCAGLNGIAKVLIVVRVRSLVEIFHPRSSAQANAEVKVKNWKTYILSLLDSFFERKVATAWRGWKWVNVFLARSECEIKMSERRRRAR